MKLGFLREAVREGLRSIASKPNAPQDVEAYNKLQPSDFKSLIEKFGADNVIQYIKDMEAERIKYGKKEV